MTRNKCRLSSQVMLGIVLITTAFPVNAQITKLFPVTEEGPIRSTELPLQDTFSNEPYSEKIVYPLPPGVTRSPSISSIEPTPAPPASITSKTHLPSGEIGTTANESNLSKTSIPTNDDSNVSTEGILPSSTQEVIQFKQDSISNDTPLMPTTQGFLPTNPTEIKVKNEFVLSNKFNLPIEVLSTSTEQPSTRGATVPVRDEPPTSDMPLTTEGPLIQIATNNKDILIPSTDSPLDKEINTSTSQVTSPENETATTATAAPPMTCTTPVGKTGECKDIRQCPSLLKLLMREPLLVENKLYLQRSQCGRENQTVLVCCPDNVQPPNNMSPKLSLLPKPRACGSMHENRLFGGYHTEIDSYSWMALLEYSRGDNSTGFHCGGTLISDRYVLTAAHCVTDLPKSWSLKSVRLGEWDLTTTMDCSKFNDFLDCSDPHVDVAVEEIIPHKDFATTSKNRLHDIALIRLANQVNSSDFIEPICLPYGENNLHAFDEQGLDLVGWGASLERENPYYNIKEKTTTHVMALNKCRSLYEKLNVTLEPTQFCVQGRLPNDTCRIDSGGSVISFDTSNKGLGSYYLAGIQSFGTIPCWVDKMVPGVYTRVAEYLDWILENIHA